MFRMDMEGTKWTIFTVAVDLFAEKGYSSISIRDIAATAKIRPSSIYYHFESKAELLEKIIDFYDYYYTLHLPSLKELLARAETEPPRNVLRSTVFQFENNIQEMMNKIFLIVSVEALSGNEHAEYIINKTMFELPKQYLSELLTKLLDLGKIEPVDIDAFSLAFSSLCHSALLRMRTSNPVSWDDWNHSLELLFDIV